MKKLLKLLGVVMVVCCLSLTFVGCGSEYVAPDNVIGQYVLNESLINDKVVAIADCANPTDAKSVFLQSLANYYTTNYVVQYTSGMVDTRIAGGAIKVHQAVSSRKVRQNKDGALTIYQDNYSYTKDASVPIAIKIMEESVIGQNDVTIYREATKKNINFDEKLGYLTVKEWKPNKTFNKYEDYAAISANDPRMFLMYNYEAIKSATFVENVMPEGTVSYTKDDFKTIKVSLDLERGPTSAITFDVNGVKILGSEFDKGYVDVMKDMLRKNGFDDAIIDFIKLDFTVEVWNNGLIKKMSNDEAYIMKIALTSAIKLNGEVGLISDVYYSYDPSNEADIRNVKTFDELTKFSK
ncbi:MAG: hypothetical protein RR374_02260 [Clostridia bacterium]